MAKRQPDYDALLDVLDTALIESAEYKNALDAMETLAEDGSVDAAEVIAEIFASPGPHSDAEKAYHWYFIALSAQGYTTAFDDQNHTPPHYRRPDGDFRNEAQVNGLVKELGFFRVRALDQVAEAWLRKWRDSGD